MNKLNFEHKIGYKKHYTGCLEVPMEDDRWINSDRMAYSSVKLNCLEKLKKGIIESTASRSAVGRQLVLDIKTNKIDMERMKYDDSATRNERTFRF